MLEYKWKEADLPSNEQIEALKNSINVNRIVATLLCQRGVKDFESAKQFFRPALTQLHNPFLFRDMAKAVERIEFAIEKGQKILIYGDYDADGVCASAIIITCLRKLGAQHVSVFIPHRETDGYGLNPKTIELSSLLLLSLVF